MREKEREGARDIGIQRERENKDEKSIY